MTLKSQVASLIGVKEEDVVAGLLVHLNILFYALAFWLQQPALPFLSKNIGSDEVLWGYQQSLRSLFALLGGPLMGRLADSRGGKISLIVAHLSSAIQYTIIASASSVSHLMIAAIPALFQHAMLCGQTSVSVLSSEKERSKALGRLGLSYGIGMVIGSSLGGFLSDSFGTQTTAYWASAVSLGVVLMDAIILPPLVPTSSSSSSSSLDMGVAVRLLGKQEVRSIVIFSTILTIGTSAYRAMLAPLLSDLYGAGSSEFGMLTSFGAGVSLFTNVFLVGSLTANLGDFNVCISSTILLGLTYLLITFATTFRLFFIFMIPNAIASTFLYTVTGAMLSKVVSKNEAGTAISLSHACRSLTGMAGPIIGGFILASDWSEGEEQKQKAAAFQIFCGVGAFLAAGYMLSCQSLKRRSQSDHLKE